MTKDGKSEKKWEIEKVVLTFGNKDQPYSQRLKINFPEFPEFPPFFEAIIFPKIRNSVFGLKRRVSFKKIN